MGGKVFIYYLLTSAVAIIIGLTVANSFNSGTDMQLDTSETVQVPEKPEITNILLNIVPENIVTAFSDMSLKYPLLFFIYVINPFTDLF